LGLRLGRDGPLAPPVPERPGMPTARSVTAMLAAHARSARDGKKDSPVNGTTATVFGLMSDS